MIKILFSLYWLVSTNFTGEESSQSKIFFERNFDYLDYALIILLATFIASTVYYYRKFNKRAGVNRFNELLLNEIHHRVKNNLQLIISLFNMQARKSDNQEVISILKKNMERIKIFSVVHDILFIQESTDNISMDNFISQISKANKNLRRDRVDFYIDAKEIQLNADVALPLGLIINELITNSFKYAFFESKSEKHLIIHEDAMIAIEGKPNTIKILLKQKATKVLELIYQDSGPGIPNWVDIKSAKSMGMKLIHGLSKQMNGSVVYSEENNQFVIRLNKSFK